MTEEKKTPETLNEKDLDDAKGGYSVWIGGSVQDNTVKPEYEVASAPTLQDNGTAQGGKGHDTLIFPKKKG